MLFVERPQLKALLTDQLLRVIPPPEASKAVVAEAATSAARSALEVEVAAFLTDLLHVLSQQCSAVPVNKQGLTPLDVCRTVATVSAEHVAAKAFYVVPSSAAKLEQNVQAYQLKRMAALKLSTAAPQRATVALLISVYAFIVLMWCFAYNWMRGVQDYNDSGSSKAISAAVATLSGGLGALATLSVSHGLRSAEILRFDFPALASKFVRPTYLWLCAIRGWTAPVMTSVESQSLVDRCTAQVREWGLRLLTSQLRTACEAPALTPGDVMLLLDQLADLSETSSSPASSRTLAPGATSLTLGGEGNSVPLPADIITALNDASKTVQVHETAIPTGLNGEVTGLLKKLLHRLVDPQAPLLAGLQESDGASAADTIASSIEQTLTTNLAHAPDPVMAMQHYVLRGDEAPILQLCQDTNPNLLQDKDDAGAASAATAAAASSSTSCMWRSQLAELVKRRRQRLQQRQSAASAMSAAASSSAASTAAAEGSAPRRARGNKSARTIPAEDALRGATATVSVPGQHKQTVEEAIKAGGYYVRRHKGHYILTRVVVFPNGDNMRQTIVQSSTPSSRYHGRMEQAAVKRNNQAVKDRLELTATLATAQAVQRLRELVES